MSERGRGGGLAPVALAAGRVTRPLFGKRGFAGGALATDWPAIVGSAVASHALPIRITFPPGERTGGTLVVKVDSGSFATEMQHLEPLILERINGHFGYGAVSRLKLLQGPLPRRLTPAPPPPEPTTACLTPALERIDDPDLRAALERLGRWVKE